MATSRRISVRELGSAELGDVRRQERLVEVAAALERRPRESLPVALGTDSALEAGYRLLSNPNVTFDAILQAHIEATAGRVRRERRVYAASDTTEFRFGGESRSGLGPLQGIDRGFLCHVCLAVSADGTRIPLGILGAEIIVRPEKAKKRSGTRASRNADDRESLKWKRVALAAEAAVGPGRLVHVMDREADIYELLAELAGGQHAFIVRAAQDRGLEEALPGASNVRAAVTTAPVRFTREVPLSRRTKDAKQHKKRAQRQAMLSVAATRLAVRRPPSADKHLPAHLDLNFVHVWEEMPPAGEKPVEWILITTEPIGTDADLESVIDGYRTRWVIEEFFKAIKTGCAFEMSQLESGEALANLLAIKMPIAAQLVALRGQAALNEKALRRGLIEPLRLQVLRTMVRGNLPEDPTAAEVIAAIARLGAHIKNNGAPGWQVLARGMDALIHYEFAWLAIKAAEK